MVPDGIPGPQRNAARGSPSPARRPRAILGGVSPLATVIVAWAAVYAYVCAYFCVLYSRRRGERVHLAFGLMAGALCIYAVGSALLVDAGTVAEATLGQRVRALGLAPGVVFVVEFCHRLVGRPRSRLIHAAYGWAGVTILLTVLNQHVDASTPAPHPTWGFAGVPDYPEASLTPLGQLNLSISFVLVAWGIAVLLRPARTDRDARLMLATMVVNIVAAAHDSAVAFGLLRSVHLLEHAAMLSVVAMSYLLLDRFVRTSEELASRTFQLRSSYDELRHTQEELVHKEQLAAVGELSAVIAHKVRNPLAVIKNSVSGLRRPRLEDRDRDTLLSILDEEVDRLNRLVNDLLAYSRPVAPQGRQVELPELLQRSVDLARGGSRAAAEVLVDVIESPGPTSVHGDPDLLRHAFVNIVENAIQAMGAGGRLAIKTRAVHRDRRDWIAVDFEDTGEGMDTQIRSKARDPFFTTRPTGTGLGLAIVERVVRTHGGRVEIDSRSGQGTTVTVLLPTEAPPKEHRAAARVLEVET